MRNHCGFFKLFTEMRVYFALGIQLGIQLSLSKKVNYFSYLAPIVYLFFYFIYRGLGKGV